MKHFKQKKITYYKDNPKLKRQIIITVTGDTEYKCNCININDLYFTKDIHCKLIRGKYYSILNNKNVIFDEEKKVYDLINFKDNFIYGIVEFDKFNEPRRGYFSQNLYKNCFISYSDKIFSESNDCYRETISQRSKVINKKGEPCISYDIIPETFFTKDINDNIYYANKIKFKNFKINTEHLNSYKEKLTQTLKIKKQFSTKNKNYVAENNDFAHKVELFQNSQFPIQPSIRKLAKFLGNYSFGIEVELKDGTLDNNLQAKYGLVLCKDGSIGYTPEFATVPFHGCKGLQATKNMFEEFNKSCTTDYQRSIHVHFGNIPTDRGFLISLYHLFLRIQTELYKIFPRYKYDNNGVKNMNYTAPLLHIFKDTTFNSDKSYKSQVNDYYYKLYKHLNAGQNFDFKYNKKTKKHLNGDLSRNKWNIRSRYHALNMTHLFFSNRNTIEFRLHQAVLEDYKMINWLLICSAITRFAEQHQKRILTDSKEITLDEVLTEGLKLKTHPLRSGKLVEYLNNYVHNRKTIFAEDLNNGDHISDGDGKGQPRYSFSSIFDHF